MRYIELNPVRTTMVEHPGKIGVREHLLQIVEKIPL